MFQDSGVRDVTSCHFLGGIIGDFPGRIEYVNMKVDEWECCRLLTSATNDLLQEVNIAFSKSLQNEWAFLQRVTPDCSHLFRPIENALSSIFIPALLGHDISTRDCSLFSLPVHFGGLNIRDPTINAKSLYDASRCATQALIDVIKGDSDLCLADHDNLVTSVRHDWIKEQQTLHNHIFSDIFKSSDAVSQRSLS